MRSDEGYQDVKNMVEIKTHAPVRVKGKSEPIIVHTVIGLKDKS